MFDLFCDTCGRWLFSGTGLPDDEASELLNCRCGGRGRITAEMIARYSAIVAMHRTQLESESAHQKPWDGVLWLG